MTPVAYVLLGLGVAFATFVQSVIGVGFALIVVPIAAWPRPDLLPTFVLVLMLPLNAYVLWRERTALDLGGVGWITAGRLIGTFAGIGILALAPPALLARLIGGTTLAAVALSVVAPSLRPGRGTYACAGLATGIAETATGIGGPPLALVFQSRPKAVLRSSIAACFLIGEAVSLVALWMGRLADVADMVHAAAFLPAVLAGAAAGHALYRRVPQRLLRTAVLVFAAVSSLALMA